MIDTNSRFRAMSEETRAIFEQTLSRTFAFSGYCSDYNSMTREERWKYFSETERQHIDFIRAMPLCELRHFCERKSGVKTQIRGCNGAIVESYKLNEELDKILKESGLVLISD